jgi:hypothetical protein
LPIPLLPPVTMTVGIDTDMKRKSERRSEKVFSFYLFLRYMAAIIYYNNYNDEEKRF